MRNKGVLRLITALLAVVLCVTAFSMPAFAYSDVDQEPNTEPGAEAEADQDISELLSVLAGAQVNLSITADGDGIKITAGTAEEQKQTGTVTTNGGNLNVRTGAGLDNKAFTQLFNGTIVEVIGTDGD